MKTLLSMTALAALMMGAAVTTVQAEGGSDRLVDYRLEQQAVVNSRSSQGSAERFVRWSRSSPLLPAQNASSSSRNGSKIRNPAFCRTGCSSVLTDGVRCALSSIGGNAGNADISLATRAWLGAEPDAAGHIWQAARHAGLLGNPSRLRQRGRPKTALGLHSARPGQHIQDLAGRHLCMRPLPKSTANSVPSSATATAMACSN